MLDEAALHQGTLALVVFDYDEDDHDEEEADECADYGGVVPGFRDPAPLQGEEVADCRAQDQGRTGEVHLEELFAPGGWGGLDVGGRAESEDDDGC